MSILKISKAVGAKIRSRRENLNYSQESFADHIFLDRSNYGAIERGGRHISIYTLARISVGLDSEVSDLFPTLKETKELMRK